MKKTENDMSDIVIIYIVIMNIYFEKVVNEIAHGFFCETLSYRNLNI